MDENGQEKVEVEIDTSEIEAKIGVLDQTLKQIQAEISEIASIIRRSFE
ncbi:MAG: hypothetical protein GOVbin1630_7 [Prokaryotic dsDNA virus sp.]|nr:MAG: hypothetical protein GOVbin1630_7 [Prokaryotic dsDNA virus sp.]|tara:strand:- start:636 stop:782 length:147 start_codon:yes stop_codon:yes gene_type:complete